MTSEEDAILRLHQAHTGMLDIKTDFDIEDRADLQKAYTPGVAVLSRMIAEKPELKDKFTVSGKLVALITDLQVLRRHQPRRHCRTALF